MPSKSRKAADEGSPRKSNAADCIYQFKVTLKGTQPPIWRRIQVCKGTLADLHEAIQAAMGWTNTHLYGFVIRGEMYGDPGMLDDLDCIDSSETTLDEILPASNKSFAFKYEYDFGDSWLHEIKFERATAADPKLKYPRCVAGERACPPEDCGGAWGYSDLLEAIRDPKNPEHATMLEWVPADFDPEAFDAAIATRDMQRASPR